MSTFTTRPELKGTFGMVASTHWLASAAGMAILEAGGNAFDAAVGMGFALQVVEPHLNGPGGEVPIVLYDTRRPGLDGVEVICGQGVAPQAATIAHYKSEGLELIPGSGLLSTVVPGAFDAWMLMLRDHGTMHPRQVLSYAIGYAERGYALVPMICETIGQVEELFRDHWATSAALYLPNGSVPEPGSLFRNPGMAATYKRLLDEGEAVGGDREAQIEAMRRAWYQGFVAETMERFCRDNLLMDGSGEPHRGVLTGDDMARWQATKERPTTLDYKGYTLCKNGFWSQGPTFLQQLALLDGFDIAAMDSVGVDFVHTVTECAKLAFADREAFYGDPNFVEVPAERLLAADYAAARRELVGQDASMELRPGEIPGYGAPIDYTLVERNLDAETFSALGGGEPTVGPAGGPAGIEMPPPGDTCHLDVIDKDGNMVGATPSGGWLHSSPHIPELGFCLNSRAQMFWLEEGVPSSLAPGKRPRTTLSVNLALKDGEPYMVFGTPGGDSQDQWTLTFFARHSQHGMNLQEAIDAPMFQTNHMPSSFWPREADLGSLLLEDRFSDGDVRELEKRGHKIEQKEPWSLGRLSAVSKTGEVLKGAANPRLMQGYAIGR